MRSHLRWCAVSVPFTLVVCAASGAVPKAQQAATSSSASAWAAPLTPDGRPDLQGVWTNATLTPLERPRQLADRAFLTEEEAAALEAQAAGRQAAADDSRTREQALAKGDIGSYNQFWFDSGTTVLATRQTSLVVDPPDGRVPVRPEAEARRDCGARAQHRRARVHEHVGPLHLTWCARVDHPGRLQQRLPDRADVRTTS